MRSRQSLILPGAAALGAQDSLLLVKQRIHYALAMFGQRPVRQIVHREIAILIDFIVLGRAQRPADNAAAEREHDLLLQWFRVDSDELADFDLQAGLFAYLAAHCLVYGLAGINSASWQVPPVDLSPVRQQHALSLENERGDTDAETMCIIQSGRYITRHNFSPSNLFALLESINRIGRIMQNLAGQQVGLLFIDLIVLNHLIQHLAKHAASSDRRGPMHFREKDAIRTIQ